MPSPQGNCNFYILPSVQHEITALHVHAKDQLQGTCNTQHKLQDIQSTKMDFIK